MGGVVMGYSVPFAAIVLHRMKDSNGDDEAPGGLRQARGSQAYSGPDWHVIAKPRLRCRQPIAAAGGRLGSRAITTATRDERSPARPANGRCRPAAGSAASHPRSLRQARLAQGVNVLCTIFGSAKKSDPIR